MVDQVARLTAQYDDQVSAGAKAAADALQKVGAAAEYSEQRVTRASKSGDQLSRQYGEQERLAARVAAVTNRFAREVADLEASELSLAKKEELKANILARQEVEIRKVTTAHERWVAGMRAAEAAAGAQSSASAAMTASAGAFGRSLQDQGAALAVASAGQARLTNAIGLTKAQMAALTPQINDVVSGLIMGQAPMTIFAQQSGHIVEALRAGGSEMPKFRASTLAVAGGLTLLTVAAVATAARMASIRSEARELDTITKTLNPNLGATAEQLRAISFAVAEHGTSRSTGMAALSAVIRDARIQSAGLAEQIAKLSVDVAAVMGGEVADWAKKLTESAATGSQGFDKLLGTLPGITAETLKAMRAAEQHGDRLGALKIGVDALEKQYGGSAKKMKGDWDTAIHEMGRAFDDLLEKIANSDPAKAAGRAAAQAAKGFGWWVNGAPAEVQKAQQMADLDRQFQQATSLMGQYMEEGVTDQRVDKLRVHIANLQAQMYQLASASNAAAKATSAATGGGGGAGGGGAGGPANQNSPGGAVFALTEDDKNRLNLAAGATERQAAASKLLGGALSVSARAAAENRIALADMAMQYPGLGAGTATAILTSKDFAATLKTLPPELQGVWKAMESNAAVKLSGDVAQAGVSLSSAANAARLNAEAAGQGEAAMRRAAIEAEVYAHRMDGTAGAVRAALEEQEKYARAQIHAEFARGIDQEVAATERLVVAMANGAEATRDAEIYNAAYLQTLRETTPAEANWGEKLKANIDLLNRKAKAADSKVFADYTKQLEAQSRQLDLQQRLVGAPAGQSARLRAEAEISEMLIRQGRTYESLTDAERKVIDAAHDRAVANADLEVTIQRQQDAYQTLANSLEKAFDRVGDAIVDAFVRGEGKAISFGDITKGILASLLSDMLKMSVVNPFSNAVLGTSRGTLLDLFGSPANQNAANQNAAGLTGQATDMATNWGAGKALSWAGDKLGLTGGFEAAMSTPLWTGTSGVAPGFVDVVGAEAITNTAAATGGGATLGGVLGAAGAGALGGTIGGMIGTSANSKAVGGLSGAALGAGAAYGANLLGLSALGGPIGLGIGAVVGGIMGLVGTQKASVGPNAQGNVVVSGGRFAEGPSAADNKGDASGVKQATAQIAAAMNAMASAYGLRAPDGTYGLYTGGDKVKGNGVRTPEELIRQLVGSLSADGLVGRALGSDVVKGSSDLEQINSYLSLAKRIETATTALSDLDKSLAGVQKAAFKAAADGILPMLEEMRKAGEIGASAEYKALVSGQVSSLLDDIANPRTYTETQTAVATLTGQMAAWKSVLEQVNPELAKTIDTIQAKGLERIYQGVRTTYAANMNEAKGLGYRNNLQGVRDYWNANATDMVLAGRDPNALYEAQARAIIDGLTDSQINDVVSYFRDLDPVMAGLADSLRGTTTAAKEAQKAVQANADSLTAWLNGQKLGDSSSLSPWAKMEEAQRQFDAALSASRQNGDISGATKAADALLSASKPTLVLGTEAYTQREAWITSTLKNLGHELGLPGFKTGGSFEVGGWGGVDSTLVRFMATPGERVTVTRPDQRQAAERTVVVKDNSDVVRALSQVVNVLSAKLDAVTAELSSLKGEQAKETNRKLVA